MQVYRIYHLGSGKSYIGATRFSFEKRYSAGKWWKWTHNSYLKNAVKKYGIDLFEWEVLWEGNVEEGELSSLEKTYINQYNSVYPNGYNLTIGGLDPSDWNYKEYELIDYCGNTHYVVNLRLFCEENNLNYSAMCNMVSDRHPVSQGYALASFRGEIPNPNKIIELENIKTGKIERVLDQNTSKWATKKGLEGKKVRALVLKKQKVYKNWKLTETDLSEYKKPGPSKEVTLRTPDEQLIKITNIYQFCKEKGFERGPFYDLIKGKSLTAYGYTLPLSKKELYKKRKERQGKEATLISPEGKEVKIKNISEFCRQNGLSNQGVYSIIKGRTKSHKGWTVKK